MRQKKFKQLPLAGPGTSILIVCILLLPIGITAQKTYDYTVNVSSKVQGRISETVDDMIYWMEKGTGKKFKIKEGPGIKKDGINIILAQDVTLPDSISKKINADGQSFYLSVDGSESASIVGIGNNSLVNGIYTFLQILGFRWYMPGDAWAIIPDLKNVKISINKVFTPDFQTRTYFGTGGIAAVAGLDPQNSFKKDFDIWNRRNRFGGDYISKGHMGQAFYSAEKQELDQHPEYFCNNKINNAGRIDISKQGAVDVFVGWALSQRNSNNSFPVIGVDPADGSGGKDDCLPSNMPQVRTWSDKYFFLANKVAEKLPADDSKTWVQLYAYASHAAPPNFELNKKIYPVIIPYAFQNVSEPEQFIELWRRKMKGLPMGIYDYWNITQWSSDVPQFNIYSIPKRLRLWKKNNITTVSLESTNAKGPLGHALWIAAQMMWDVDLSFDKLYQQFLNDCFGLAAEDVKKMYDRWSLNYQGSMEVALSAQNLDDASAKTTDTSILNRLSELKAYVKYLGCYYDYRYNPNMQSYKNLVNYIYSIHHLRLVQTYPLIANYIKDPSGHRPQVKNSSFGSEAEGIKQLNRDNIEKSFKEDLRSNPVSYKISGLNFDVSKASPANNRGRDYYSPLYLNGQNEYLFYLPNSKTLELQAGATDATKLYIMDNEGKVAYEDTIKGSQQGYRTIKIQLGAGNYKIIFGGLYRKSRIIFPKDISFLSQTNFYDNYRYPLLYIYVPKDVSEIIYTDELGPGIGNRGNWIDPDGKIVQPQKLKYTTYRVAVPAGCRGRVWVLDIGHTKFRMLNIPNFYSLNNFTYRE